ncbi:MAG: UDP-2,3-diacylglucosamine diphosphatase LpxI [Alphaproteobacteria bacterium]|jgi:DUF1009 family protein|nr:UDP-2,3-diacylglucosamine diphosphatase LpxI [Alphaproteobacteria bacterium]
MLALIAGQGGLPPHLARVLAARGEPPLVCEMEQFPSDVTGYYPRLTFRLETLGTFLARLVEIGVTQVCMAGAVRRPEIDPARIDALTASLVPRLKAAMALGDDGTLREIIAVFEEYGLSVIGAYQVDPDLVPRAGVLCGTLPDDIAADIAAGQAALARMGAADLGQAVILRAGRVVAQEDDRGTAALLAGVEGGADGGLLYKAPKPGQDLRVDMPTIGPDTAAQAVRAGLSGIVVQAGGVIVLDRAALVAALNAAGLFLWVHP